MSEIRYCVNGCTRRDGDAKRRVTTTPPSQLCGRCEDHLATWLDRIPDAYAILPSFVLPGTTERNPESKATKRTQAPTPVREEVLDLLDTRAGRKWQGTEPTEDHRGAYGTLLAIAREIHDGRNLTGPLPTSVTTACAYITRHMLWLAEQDWVTEPYEEIRRLHRELADAIGDYRRPPVGHCHIPTDEDGARCGGGLYANPYGGVRCGRCGATWDAAHLRQLGLAQAQETA